MVSMVVVRLRISLSDKHKLRQKLVVVCAET